MQAPPPSYNESGSYAVGNHPEGYQPKQAAPAPYPIANNQPTSQPLNQPPNNQYAFVPQANLERFRRICQQNEISDFFALKLRQLEGFEIVLIADDSGSMSTPLQNAATYQSGNPQSMSQAAFAPTFRRWDELKNCVSIIVDIASCFDADGIDLYFLNRVGMLHATDPSQIGQAFQSPPSGFTPINQTLVNVLQQKAAIMSEKKLLVLILTDGEPTDASGQPNIGELERTLRQRSSQCHVTFVACTDDDSVMSYLNGWDESIPRLDVIDDYISEKKEILAVQGQQFRFSHGDWIVKALLGSIDPTLDKLDERKHGGTPGLVQPANTTSCCVMM